MDTEVEDTLGHEQSSTNDSSNFRSHHENLLRFQNTVFEERSQGDMPTDLQHHLNQPLAKL